MTVGFVILTWNRYRFLEKCLSALTESLEAPENCEIVVMDNGSTDSTPDILRKYENDILVRSIRLKKNYGLNAYKKLLDSVKTDYIVIVDDDVLEFPPGVDRIFTNYMQTFPDFGFIALNVIQNEFSNGAKPGPECYEEVTVDGKTLERGPTGGWCSCFRRIDYLKIRFWLQFFSLNMKRGEDSTIEGLFRKMLSLKSGIIRDEVCFHACGPYYAKEYGHLDREIEKYAKSGLSSFVNDYKSYQDKK